MLHNYVISLTSAEERRAHITQEFTRHGVPFRFFDAVTPVNLDAAIQKLVPRFGMAGYLTPGEQSCLMSHVCLWRHCLDENLPYIGIFEDDIWLGQASQAFLADTAWLSERFQAGESFVIRLETFYEACRVKPSAKIGHAGRQLPLLRSPHHGTGGYIISRTAAEWLLARLNATETDDFRPIDVLLFDELLFDRHIGIYQLNPALCIQQMTASPEHTALPSQLEDGRRQKPRHKARRTLPQKLHREIRRLYRQFRRWQSRSLPEQTVPFE